MISQTSFCGSQIQQNNNSNCDACSCYSNVVNDNAEVETYYIPVVVHVIYSTPNAPENISFTQIESAINKLNGDFRRIDFENVSPRIEYFLARVDQFGECTDGVVRKMSNLTFSVPFPSDPLNNLDPEEIKQLSFWDQSRYLNIWVVNTVDEGRGGYSSLPFLGNPLNRGIVVDFKEIENVLSHEAGHFFGLWHISGCTTNCEDICGLSDFDAESLGDLVADTPPCFSLPGGDCTASFAHTCSDPIVTGNVEPCSGTPTLFPKTNRMSEFNECANSFTSGQFSRMFYFLNHFQRSIWYPGYIIKKEMIVEEETKFHKDVNIYAGGRLVIKAEAIMAEGTSIIVHEGGQLVVDGGKIRACDVSEEERSTWNGIHVEGRGSDGYDVELLYSTIEDVDGFAVNMVANHNNPNLANGQLNAMRSTFNNVDGLAKFASIKRNSNNSIFDFCIQNGGENGISNINNLGIEIKNSKFYDIEDVCVSTTGGSFSIETNEFYSDNIDVALTHIMKGAPSSIKNGNEFKGDLYGIRASGPTSGNHTIEGNIFYGQEPDPDVFVSYIDRDIYMDGITDYTINYNEFFGHIGVSSRATDNTSSGSNTVSNNEFRGNLTGIYPHASNPDYFFSDNCFSTLGTDARIEGAMADQGEEGGIPPNNCFTNQGTPSSGYTVVDIGGSPDVFDYVVPLLDNVDCRNALLAPQVGVNILFTSNNPGIECEGGGRDRSYRSEGMDMDYNLYEHMNSIGASIAESNYNAARARLSQIDITFEAGADIYYIAINLIDLFETPNNDNYDTAALIQGLKLISMKEHPSSGYSQAFHYYLTGEFVDNLDLTFLEENEVGEREYNNSESKPIEYGVKIFPNPASDNIEISNFEQIIDLKVYNSFGNLIFENKGASEINTQGWTNGVYIIKIQTKEGSSKLHKIIISK